MLNTGAPKRSNPDTKKRWHRNCSNLLGEIVGNIQTQVGLIRMLFFTQPNTDKAQTGNLLSEFYSVEFPLVHVQPLYQFKLWRSDQNTFFLLAKESSDLVSRLKVGRIVPMKYYSEDAMHVTETHDTEITEIVKITFGRFRGHYRIGLNIVSDGHDKSRITEKNDN
jgi:hypothetical protein